MKKLIFLLTVFTTNISFSQIEEGYFQYTIDVEAMDTSLETRQNAGLLRDSKMEFYFSKDLLRVDFSLGKISESKIIINHAENKALTLMKSPYGNFASIKNADQLDYSNATDTNIVLTLFDDERTVLGFKCKKASIVSNGIETIYWYTNEIEANFQGQPLFNEQIPGFPLIFSTVDKGLSISYQVSNYESVITDKSTVFSLTPPAEYKLMP